MARLPIVQLGTPRQLRHLPQRCSICNREIEENAVPLMLFGPDRPDGDCDAWVYCDPCGKPILTAMIRP
jgi:hypothetical protein